MLLGEKSLLVPGKPMDGKQHMSFEQSQAIFQSKLAHHGDLSCIVAQEGEPQEPQKRLEKLLEALAQWIYKELGRTPFEEARLRFQQKMGQSFPEEGSYHSHSQYFLDAFLFTESLPSSLLRTKLPLSPYAYFLERRAPMLPQGQYLAFKELGSFRHSLFRILGFVKKELLLEDFLQPSLLWKLSSPYHWDHSLKGSFLQGFLFPLEGSYRLSSGFFLHQGEPARGKPWPRSSQDALAWASKVYLQGKRQLENRLRNLHPF